jgi:tripartite-type tricarboxylate transporter receptor subunit TctC
MTMGTSGVLAVNPAVFAKLPYDVTKDFIYVGGLAITPMIIVVSAALPYNTIQELIAAAKKEPGKFNVGYGGVNNTQHLTGDLFKFTTGVNMVGVNYKGSAAAVTDLLGGQISILVDSMAVALPHIKAGKLKPLAITTLQRVPQLPDLPTVAESTGLTEYSVEAWQGVFVPAGTAPEIVKRLNAEIVKILRTQEVSKFLLDRGSEPVGSSVSEFSALVQSEFVKYGALAKKIQLKVE